MKRNWKILRNHRKGKIKGENKRKKKIHDIDVHDADAPVKMMMLMTVVMITFGMLKMNFRKLEKMIMESKQSY